MKHTPGPWYTKGQWDRMNHCIHVGNSAGDIEVRTDNGRADALLIAATPLLYQVAQAVMDYEVGLKGGLSDCVRLAREALSQIEGR